ncbi:Transcription factor 25 [Coemansia javaensis]|uniref:Transcription factor 25 n=1 Tax=Coemansia javaensis TaxID=2761396 RepID=A0A9W8HGU9_9FUNG|nr:Transcription factor 25 [Coemansia javaensis]
MSSRAVRRFLKERGYDDLAENTARIERNAQQQRQQQQQQQQTSEDEADGGSGKANMFDLLMGGDGDDSGGSDDGGGSDGASDRGAVNSSNKEAQEEEKQQRREQPKQGGGGKRKGKQKKRGRSGAAEDMTMEEFEAELSNAREQAARDPVRREPERGRSGGGRGEALGVVLTDEQQRNRALLVADPKHLDPAVEIRRLFGSAALQGADGGGGGNGNGNGRRRGAGRLGSRRLALSHPKATWPAMQAAPGVEMRAVEGDEAAAAAAADPTGGQWFVLEHTARFRAVQLEFLAAVMTHDADGVAALAHQHPYHVDALLQLSEIMKQTGGDLNEAGELVERALFALEQGFAPRFSATNGMARLDFRRIESRGLFLALFRHMQFLARRGCWRTAFEANKVLLALDPARDPYGALLTLDLHALKSRQYEYVRRFVAEWTWSPVALLPNWAFSRALAEFMLEGGGGRRKKGAAPAAPKPAAAPSASTDMLVEAILVFPTVVPPLWTKAGISVDPVVLTHPYFQDEQIPDESAMTHMQLLVHMFVERCGALYRPPEVGRWLQEGLLLALEQIALGGADARDVAAAAGPAVAARRREAQRRLCTYVIPEAVSRHVLVAEMEAMKAGLPAEIREAPSFAFDPLPPRDDINVYDELLADTGIADARMLQMPGAFGALADIEAGAEALPVIQGLIDRIRRLAGLQDAEDPGTSDDDDEDGQE